MKAVLLAVVVPLLTFAPATRATQSTLARAQQAEFLKTARVIKAETVGKGVTRPFRLTLSDGTITHDAAFQSIDQTRAVSHGTGRRRTVELNFTDSWRFNVAAPRVAELIGMGDMVPVSVARSWNGKPGAFTWWVDDVLMDEEERSKTNTTAPDKDAWIAQGLRQRLFTQLVHDTDRNQGNTLITKDWRLVMIDFTRAFRAWNHTPSPLVTLRRCDGAVLEALRRLTKPALQQATGEYLTPYEIDALLVRRDLIVKHFDELIARLGEKEVIY